MELKSYGFKEFENLRQENLKNKKIKSIRPVHEAWAGRGKNAEVVEQLKQRVMAIVENIKWYDKLSWYAEALERV